MKKPSTLFYYLNSFENAGYMHREEDFTPEDAVQYQQLFKYLDTARANPSEESVQKILEFAKTYNE